MKFSSLNLRELIYRSAPSEGGAVVKPFKFSFVFRRDSDNSPGAGAYFPSLIPGFEQFPFFLPLLRAVVSESSLLKEVSRVLTPREVDRG